MASDQDTADGAPLSTQPPPFRPFLATEQEPPPDPQPSGAELELHHRRQVRR